MGWGEAWDHVGKEDVPLPHPTPQQVPGAERAQTRLQKETGDPGWAGRRLRWGLGGSPSWGGGLTSLQPATAPSPLLCPGRASRPPGSPYIRPAALGSTSRAIQGCAS